MTLEDFLEFKEFIDSFAAIDESSRVDIAKDQARKQVK